MKNRLREFSMLPLFNKFRLIVCILLFVAAFGIVTFGYLKIGADSEIYNNNAKQISQLKAQLRELDEVEVVQSDTIKEDLSSCSAVGKEVAKYQTAYKGMTKEKELTANADKLASFFSADADSQVPWYSGDYKSDYVWEFRTNYEFNSKLLPVLWTCKDKKTGELLAYATAEYNLTNKLFSKASWAMTSEGAKRADAT